MATRKRVAKDVRKLVGRTHGEDITNKIDRITRVAGSEFNLVAIMNKPFSSATLAAVNFAEIHCVDVESGIPQIDTEAFNLFSAEEKLKDIKGLIASIASMVNTFDQLNKGFTGFLQYLFEIEHSLEEELKK